MISLSDDKQADAIDAFNTTVHSRYLGSKKPLGGFYHYINITVCIELRIGRFLEAERTTQDGGPFNTGKVGVSLYPI